MAIDKTRGKPDFEVLVSASLALLVDTLVSHAGLRSFGLLLSPATAFYTAVIIKTQFRHFLLRKRQRKYEANLRAEIETLLREKDYCNDPCRQREIEDQIKYYRGMLFEMKVQELQFGKPNYQRAGKTRRVLK